jgi:putative phosphoribosyl transferase
MVGRREGSRPSSGFADRSEAGRILADRLRYLKGSGAVVLALPRGGVPVGYEIAMTAGVELDVLVLRKVAARSDPEYGLGAVTESGELFLDEPRVRALGLSREDLGPVVREEQAEAARRSRLYRGGRPPTSVAGRIVVLTDDGVATGGTVRAALQILKRLGPSRIIVALGVSPPDTYRALVREADDVECALVADPFFSVGQFYRAFEPVEDRIVVALLTAAAGGTFVPPRP